MLSFLLAREERDGTRTYILDVGEEIYAATATYLGDTATITMNQCRDEYRQFFVRSLVNANMHCQTIAFDSVCSELSEIGFLQEGQTMVARVEDIKFMCRCSTD